MRKIQLLVIAAMFALVVGCNWMKEWREGLDQNRQRASGKIGPWSAKEAVDYLNAQARLLQSIEYDTVHLRCFEKGMPTPVVDGNLACAQPRYFRMHVGKMTSDVDLGSNLEQFWVYLKLPGDPPMYVYASHSDYDAGLAKLPGGLPFDPDWVMQAFGMTRFDDTIPYEQVRFVQEPPSSRRSGIDTHPPDPLTIPINEKDRTYTLTWASTAPGGLLVRKEIVFEADSATGTRPRVKKHVVRDSRTNKVITSAEIKSVQTALVSDGGTRSQVPVQYPTHIVLRWEEQKFEMDLRLEKAQVNQPLVNDPTRRLFDLPKIRGTDPINLAGAQFGPVR
jgi:hypothetical protein